MIFEPTQSVAEDNSESLVEGLVENNVHNVVFVFVYLAQKGALSYSGLSEIRKANSEKCCYLVC